MARGAVKISMNGIGKLNTAKMKHLVARITSNTSGTMCKDRQAVGRAGRSFEKELTRAKELSNGVGRVDIRSHSSDFEDIAGNREIGRVRNGINRKIK